MNLAARQLKKAEAPGAKIQPEKDASTATGRTKQTRVPGSSLLGRVEAIRQHSRKKMSERDQPTQERRQKIWNHLQQLCAQHGLPPLPLWNDLELGGDLDDPDLKPKTVKVYVESIAEDPPEWVDTAFV